jgi:uncharacterized protein with HEPN domain
MRSDSVLLRDILTAIADVERYAGHGQTEFLANELVQTWTIHHLQIIGEAASRISETLRANHREIPWKQIIAMRHILLHDYFGVDLATVWHTVENELPSLKNRIEVVLRAS